MESSAVLVEANDFIEAALWKVIDWYGQPARREWVGSFPGHR